MDATDPGCTDVMYIPQPCSLPANIILTEAEKKRAEIEINNLNGWNRARVKHLQLPTPRLQSEGKGNLNATIIIGIQ